MLYLTKKTRGNMEHSKHLNAIPSEPHMKPSNIYLVGAQCTGKTTLLEALQEYFSNAKERDGSPYYTDAPAFIREAATQVMHDNGFNSADVMDPERGIALQKSILMAQYKAEETLRDRWYISDRSGIDPIVYAQVYLGNHSAEKLLSLPEWVCLREWMRRSTVILCTPGNEEWLNDDDVRLKYGGAEEWERFSYEFSKVLEKQTIEFIVLPGGLTSLEQRVGFVIDTFSFSSQTRG